MSQQIHGSKKWTFWRYEHAPKLHPDASEAHSDCSDELFWADTTAAPGEPGYVGDIPRMEAEVQAGDVLFVPCETVHHVETTQEAMTLSYVLVDQKAATCGRNLAALSSPRYALANSQASKVYDDSTKYLAARVMHFDYTQQPLQPEPLASDMSWMEFTSRYCPQKASVDRSLLSEGSYVRDEASSEDEAGEDEWIEINSRNDAEVDRLTFDGKLKKAKAKIAKKKQMLNQALAAQTHLVSPHPVGHHAAQCES